jgi:predicted porin
VKYVSPSISGLTVVALYGFGNVAGSVGAGNAVSVGATYENGSFGTVTGKVVVTTVRNSLNRAAAWMAEGGAAWQPAPEWVVGASYTYMKGNEDLNNNHAHQVSAAVQYWLSKRTMLYTAAVYQRSSGGSNAQVNGVMDADGASSGQTQLIARVGISTKF